MKYMYAADLCINYNETIQKFKKLKVKKKLIRVTD